MRKFVAPLVLLVWTASPALAEDVQYVLHIDGITCPFCVATSESALKKMDGVKSVSSSLKDGTIVVCADDDKVAFSDEQLTTLFKEKGFTYRGMEKTDGCAA